MQGFDLTKPRSIQGKQPDSCSIVMPMAKCSLYEIISTTVEKVSTAASQVPILRASCLPKISARVITQHFAQVVKPSFGTFMSLWCSSL